MVLMVPALIAACTPVLLLLALTAAARTLLLQVLLRMAAARAPWHVEDTSDHDVDIPHELSPVVGAEICETTSSLTKLTAPGAEVPSLDPEEDASGDVGPWSSALDLGAAVAAREKGEKGERRKK